MLSSKLIVQNFTQFGCHGFIQAENKNTDIQTLFDPDAVFTAAGKLCGKTISSLANKAGDVYRYMTSSSSAAEDNHSNTPSQSVYDRPITQAPTSENYLSTVKPELETPPVVQPSNAEKTVATEASEQQPLTQPLIQEKASTPKQSRIPRAVKKHLPLKPEAEVAFLTAIPKPHVIKQDTPRAQAIHEYEKHRRVVEFRADSEKPKGKLPELSDAFLARYNKDIERRKQHTNPSNTAQSEESRHKGKPDKERLDALAKPRHQRQKNEAKPVSEMTRAEFTEIHYRQKYLRPTEGKTRFSAKY